MGGVRRPAVTGDRFSSAGAICVFTAYVASSFWPKCRDPDTDLFGIRNLEYGHNCLRYEILIPNGQSTRQQPLYGGGGGGLKYFEKVGIFEKRSALAALRRTPGEPAAPCSWPTTSPNTAELPYQMRRKRGRSAVEDYPIISL